MPVATPKPKPNKNQPKVAPKATIQTRLPKLRHPLWKGPVDDGITFSLMAKYLCCPERFRLRVVEGLVEDDGFNHAMEYGSMWHVCEESHAGSYSWDAPLQKYRTQLLAQYPGSEEQIHKWYNVCRVTFPLYVKHWHNHPDEKARKPLLEEAAFRVPYTLPSGRTITLRGKFDCVCLLPRPTEKEDRAAYKLWMTHWPKAKMGIFLQENKTKGEIDEEGIQQSVWGNLQTMLYQIALRQCHDRWVSGELDTEAYRRFGHAAFAPGTPMSKAFETIPIVGSLYNVCRRPLADRYAIKQREGRTDKSTGRKVGAETASQFYDRLAQNIQEDMTRYFMRWRVLLTPDDVTKFQQRTFNPLLERLCDWWEWISVDPHDPWRPRSNSRNIDNPITGKTCPHFQSPWGVYNSLAGGFRGDYFHYLTKGRQGGLTHISNLFPELT